ncbi:MAG: pantetheine-phosphate adenylyltransferase [Clostridiales bacterium]|nr:pantetheine-phosphate adenylyltransferase [Clostridiales bacterium]
MRAIFPGSFDPITKGHVDIIRRALKVVDELIIAIMVNPDKQGFLSAQKRKLMIEAACLEEGLSGFKVVVDDGLLVDLAKREGVSLIIKGVRSAADLEHEAAMARANKLLLPGLETVLLPANSQTAEISSTLVRQIASLGGDISHFVPACVIQAIIDQFSTLKQQD